MTRHIYAIYDKRAEDILEPIQTFKTDAQAIRFFGDILNNKNENNTIARYPEDFKLICLGTIEQNNTITPEREGELKQARTVISGELYAATTQAESELNEGAIARIPTKKHG